MKARENCRNAFSYHLTDKIHSLEKFSIAERYCCYCCYRRFCAERELYSLLCFKMCGKFCFGTCNGLWDPSRFSFFS